MRIVCGVECKKLLGETVRLAFGQDDILNKLRMHRRDASRHRHCMPELFQYRWTIYLECTMNEEKFWQLMEKVDREALEDGDADAAVEPLTEALAELPVKDIKGFDSVDDETGNNAAAWPG